jgi:hypothetical protein
MRMSNFSSATMTFPAGWADAALAIQQLAYRYAYAVDTRDRGLLESLWTEPSRRVDPPEMNLLTVREQHRRWFDKGATVHLVANHLIEPVTDDRARGVVYCVAQLDLRTHFVDRTLLYQDEYSRVAGVWKFAVRRHHVWFGEARPHNPMTQPPVSWPGGYGRGDLPGAVMPLERAAEYGFETAPET